VRGLHRFAAREGLTHDDPAREVRPPTPPRRLPKALEVDQVEGLLCIVDTSTPRGMRDRALLELLYGTGARISEATGLVVDDLDLADGTVLLHGKGSRTRLVPVGGYARDALETYLVRARPVLAEAAGRAGLSRHVSPHTLRHSYATHLLDGGADVRVVQELLGHASVTTTQVYTLVTVERLREVYATSHPRARR
jgi:integrase/recombinase XerD